jgi:hypothetical protein
MLTEGAFDRGLVIAFKGAQAGVEQVALGDDDDVEPVGDLVTTKNLSYQSFSSITLNGAAKLSGGRDPQPAMASLVPQDEHSVEATMDLRPALVHLLKIGPAANSLVGSKPHLPAADSQPFATLRAAALEHQPPVLRAHSNQKAVCTPSAARVRLKCPLALHDLLRREPSAGPEISMVANAFEECQCK